MSFSANIKNEIIHIINNRHCAIAEFSAFVNYVSKIKNTNDEPNLMFVSENEALINKCQKLIKFIFNQDIQISSNEKNKIFAIKIKEQVFIDKIFFTINQSIDQRNVSPIITKSICCKRAFIRGAFISVGYVSNPEKSYHLEFVNLSISQAEALRKIIKFFDIDAKIIEKKGFYIVYIKEGEQIVDLLNVIEAHKSLLHFENIRVLKDVRNNINRIVNCETANLNKMVLNGLKQKEDIELIENMLGLDKLPKQLKEVAIIRLKYPDISLKEVGEMLQTPISKSGVNHRLKKINKIAENLRRV